MSNYNRGISGNIYFFNVHDKIINIRIKKFFKQLININSYMLQKLPDCIAGHNEKRLLHDLLDSYNILERPVVNESDPLQLSFGLTLMQIIDVVSISPKYIYISFRISIQMHFFLTSQDEKNQMLVTNIWLKLVSQNRPTRYSWKLYILTNIFFSCFQFILTIKEWNDMNLRWNTSEYGGVKDLRIPPHRIWKPDVLMYNSADEGFDGTYATNVVVRSNGSCLYVPPGIFKSTCKIDITWFPFDDQRCEMKFGSWTYDGFQVIQSFISYANVLPLIVFWLKCCDSNECLLFVFHV